MSDTGKRFLNDVILLFYMMRIIHTLQVNQETVLSIIFRSECALLTGQAKHQLTLFVTNVSEFYTL